MISYNHDLRYTIYILNRAYNEPDRDANSYRIYGSWLSKKKRVFLN